MLQKKEGVEKRHEHILNLNQAMKNFEVKYILNILELARGDLEFAAQVLGIPRDKLNKKIDGYDYSEKLKNMEKFNS